MKKIFYVFAILVIALASCKDKPPKAEITVVDLSNKPVPDAFVRVYATPSDQNVEGNIGYIKPYERERDALKMTDSDGKVEFEFKYEAIYNVFAYKIISDTSQGIIGDTLKGTGAVILEKNKVAEETIIIR